MCCGSGGSSASIMHETALRGEGSRERFEPSTLLKTPALQTGQTPVKIFDNLNAPAFAGLFACRRCYGLAYESQQQTARHRGLEQARKIRMRLGGGVDLLAPFPQRPKGMHRRTFERLRARAEAAVFRRQV
jgi:hypothetical protein